MEQNADLSVSVVCYNNCDKIIDTIKSIIEFTKGISVDIFVSDNGSTDGSVEKIRNLFPFVTILENGENLGFGAGHNRVIPLLKSRFHAVVNPDIILKEDSLSTLADFLSSNAEVAMVTPKILNPDLSEQHLPKRKPSLKYVLSGRIGALKKWRDEYTMANIDIFEPIEVDFCSGCFFMMPTEIFKKLSGFDQRFFMYFEDADITLRAKAFGKTVFYPKTAVVHLWERQSAHSLKYLLIHILSMFKFFTKR